MHTTVCSRRRAVEEQVAARYYFPPPPNPLTHPLTNNTTPNETTASHPLLFLLHLKNESKILRASDEKDHYLSDLS